MLAKAASVLAGVVDRGAVDEVLEEDADEEEEMLLLLLLLVLDTVLDVTLLVLLDVVVAGVPTL